MSRIDEREAETAEHCSRCFKDPLALMNKDLYNKYSSSQNLYYSKEINEIIG